MCQVFTSNINGSLSIACILYDWVKTIRLYVRIINFVNHKTVVSDTMRLIRLSMGSLFILKHDLTYFAHILSDSDARFKILIINIHFKSD